MAFFGLTALGPQNCFQVSLLDFSYLDVFTTSDMEKAFNLVDREKRGFVRPEQVSPYHVKTRGHGITCTAKVWYSGQRSCLACFMSMEVIILRSTTVVLHFAFNLLLTIPEQILSGSYTTPTTAAHFLYFLSLLCMPVEGHTLCKYHIYTGTVISALSRVVLN